MSWRDQLRPASFRGVEFLVDTAEGEFGRRSVTHEYPLRDVPFVEDLGRKAREIRIEAYVLATPANDFNYMAQRDALLRAIEQEGPGALVHPYLGELRVSLTSGKLSEKTAEGGMARFSLTFVESGDAKFPTAASDTQAAVQDKADAALDACTVDFADRFTVANLPQFVSDDAIGRMTTFASQMSNIPGMIPTDPLQVAAFLPGVSDTLGDLPQLVLGPTAMARRVIQTIDALRNLPKSPDLLLGIFGVDPMNELKLLRSLFNFGKTGSASPAPSIPTTTPSRIQQASNQQAMLDLVQRTAVITAVRAVSEKDFAVSQDALAIRDELSGQLDALMLSANDAVFDGLRDLRTASVKDLTARAANLEQLVTYTPPDTRPALAIAYDLYEDASRDLEIVARNDIPHPGFVRGGQALQVIADA